MLSFGKRFGRKVTLWVRFNTNSLIKALSPKAYVLCEGPEVAHLLIRCNFGSELWNWWLLLANISWGFPCWLSAFRGSERGVSLIRRLGNYGLGLSCNSLVPFDWCNDRISTTNRNKLGLFGIQLGDFCLLVCPFQPSQINVTPFSSCTLLYIVI